MSAEIQIVDVLDIAGHVGVVLQLVAGAVDIGMAFRSTRGCTIRIRSLAFLPVDTYSAGIRLVSVELCDGVRPIPGEEMIEVTVTQASS
jgi:hypothetical protein